MMRRIATLLLVVAPCVHAQRGARAVSTAPLVIDDVTVIDGTGGPPRAHLRVVARGGMIVSVAPAGGALPDSARVIDGRGLYVIPGLIDAHVHLSGADWRARAEQLRQTLKGGVTAVYELAGDARTTGDLARAVLVHEIPGPTIYYSALMAGPPFFTDPRAVSISRGFRTGQAPWAQAITPTTDMPRAVAAARGTGATTIKLYASLDSVTATLATAEARRQGMRVVAHATTFPAKPSALIAAGVTMLAHTPYLVWQGSAPTDDWTNRARGDFVGVPATSPVIERLLREMHDRDVSLNPTLWVFAEGQPADSVSRVRTPWMNAVTKRAQELGVNIVAGTDNMMDPRRDSLPTLHKELELEVQAGLTPLQAIASATANAARAIGVDSVRGSVREGRVADLVLLDANPAEDIRNTRRIRYVIKDGAIVGDTVRSASGTLALPDSANDPHAVQPERPTVATHAGTVAPGWVEIEAGVEHDRFSPSVTGNIAPTLVKIGIANKAQLSLWAPLGHLSKAPDVNVGVKWRLLDDAPVLGDFAVLPSVKLATGSEVSGTGTGTTDGSLLLISSHRFGDVSMDLNVGYTVRNRETSTVPKTTSLWTASFGGPVDGALGWTAECYGIPGTGGVAGQAPIVALLAGPTFLARPWLALDTGIILPVTGPQPHALYAGLVYNVGHF